MNEFIEQFLTESRELVEQASADLLALEENPADSERLDGAFRAFHTLKGSAGIVDFAAMTKATHAAEDVLAAVRAGNAQITRPMISDGLACLDLVTQWLDAMAVNGEIPADAEAAAESMARRLTIGSGPMREPPAEGHASAVACSVPPGEFSHAARQVLEAQILLLRETVEEGLVGRLMSAGRVAINVLHHCGKSSDIAALERALAEGAANGDAGLLLALLERILRSEDKTPPPAGPADATARVLRVDVERLDAIVRLTGELTVAKNAIGHAVALAQQNIDPKALADVFKEQHATIDRLVGELQRSVLGIRVLPLRHVFQRFPRLVREVAETLGKRVNLITDGDATEADKVVVENLFEPLLHVVRNALIHGVETPDERARLGKPAVASIRLSASRTGERVIVMVEDDGRGLDVARIRKVAEERQLMDKDALAALSDEEAAELIFAPGFSTAEKVTDLSGRGVGMNVVRTNVERLGGRATIASRPGSGTTVTLKLPFSVMMTRVMTVEAGGQTFGIPLDAVIETARIPRDKVSDIGAARAFVLRDRTVPLIDLALTLGGAARSTVPDYANVVVVSLGGLLGSLEVDRLGDRMDVMLQPLDGLLRGTKGMAGTSLLGDGGVLIVLDMHELLQ